MPTLLGHDDLHWRPQKSLNSKVFCFPVLSVSWLRFYSSCCESPHWMEVLNCLATLLSKLNLGGTFFFFFYKYFILSRQQHVSKSDFVDWFCWVLFFLDLIYVFKKNPCCYFSVPSSCYIWLFVCLHVYTKDSLVHLSVLSPVLLYSLLVCSLNDRQHPVLCFVAWKWVAVVIIGIK